MRLAIGRKVLSEKTSEYLLKSMENNFGKLTYKDAQDILDNYGELDIHQEDVELPINYTDKLSFYFTYSRTYTLVRKVGFNWERLYDLHIGKDGILYEIITPDLPKKEENIMSDYEKDYEEFWKRLVENKDGTLNLDQIKRELSDYKFLMEHASSVYCELTGLSKTHYSANTILTRVFDKYIDKELVLDDLVGLAENGKISINDIKEYLR